jgi:AcrR family transcriptional regulator
MSTRDKLVEAAGDLFYERGFQAVGLDQVLERVGITKTAFYKHFDSKDALIVAVLEERDGRDVRELLAYVTQHGADPKARILAMFDFLGDWFREPGFRGCLFLNASTEFPNPNDPINRAATLHGTHMAAVVRGLLVQAGVRDPDGLTRQLMLLVGGAIQSRHMRVDLEAAGVARDAAAALLGVAAVGVE